MLNILVLLSDKLYACTGTGIIKALSLSKLNYRLFCVSSCPQKAGLYMAQDWAFSPRSDEEVYFEWLLDYCLANRIDVLFPDEVGVGKFAPWKKIFMEQTNTYLMTPPRPMIDIADDKLLTCQWLEAQGLDFPSYAMANDQRALDRLIAQKGFPLFAKTIKGCGSIGCFVVHNEEDVRKAQEKEGYIIQEFLGSIDTEYTSACFVDRDGQLRGTIAMHRYLQNGSSSYCEVVADSTILDACATIATAIGARGTINIQLRVHHNKPVCFEINPRYSSTTGIRAGFGFNDVAHAIRHYYLGEPARDLAVVRKGKAIRYSEAVFLE